MTSRTALVLTIFTQLLGAGFSQAQPSNIIGSWRVEITFSNGQSRSLRFEGGASGKGSFLPLVPKQVGPTELSAAEWTQKDKDSVTFSGPVQFPLGNVGLQRGTLVLKGNFGTDGSITGDAEFFRVDEHPADAKAKPSKSGTFKAIRAPG